MKKNKKKNRRLIILIAILTLVMGYAIVSTTLNIDGTLLLRSARWDIHWENVSVKSGSAQTESPATITNPTTVEFSVALNKPGEFYEFTVDAKNDGLVAGEIDQVLFDVYDATGEEKIDEEDIPNFVYKSFTYANGDEVEEHHVLNPGKREKYLIRIEYLDEIEEEDLEKDFTCTFKVSIKYKQTKSSETIESNATFVANTDTSKKGLIGIAYLDPTNISNRCSADSETGNMPFYAATSWPDIDAYMYNYSEFATSYAQDKGGCMKWYVYKDTGSSYKMILDHNTTGVAVPYASFAYVDEDTGEGWSGGRVNYCADKYQNLEDQKNCFDVITTTLKRDTEEWEIEDIDLISAEEMAEILEIENWEVDSYEIYDISYNYEWLLDNGETGDNASCDEPSCFVDGYWTKTKDITYIDYEGDNGVSFWSWGISTTKTRFSLINDYHTEMNDNYGIRPVITVPKNYFK